MLKRGLLLGSASDSGEVTGKHLFHGCYVIFEQETVGAIKHLYAVSELKSRIVFKVRPKTDDSFLVVSLRLPTSERK